MDFKHFREAYFFVRKYAHDNGEETLPTTDLFTDLDGDVYHVVARGQCL